MLVKKVYKIDQFQELDSTNSYAFKNLNDLSDKQVIIADKQTNGKGRLNRSWVSGQEDNVYLSIVLKPSDKISKDLPLANLTQYMSVILCKVLEDYGINSHIKWPNDVLAEDKKIAGILSQLSVQGNNLKGFVLGIGVNLNLSEQDVENIDQPAASLNILLGKPVHRDSFVEKLLEKFFENYDLFLNKGFSLIKNDYIKRCDFINKKIAISSPNGCIQSSFAKEIRDDGSLVIINSENQEKIITMGDIICL